jgi:hypothetical protein
MCFLVMVFGVFCFAIQILRDTKPGFREVRNPDPALRRKELAPVVGLACERQQGNVTRLFDGRGHRALVSGAGAGLAAWTDGTVFGDVLPKQVCLFIVNCQSLICAELTKFWFRKEAALPAALRRTEGSSIFSHFLLQF